MSAETKLQTAIIAALKQAGYHPMRNNSGLIRASGRMVRMGLGTGSADIIVCVRGRFVALEVKDKEPQSEAQKAWQAELEGDGGMYAVVRSAGEALEAVRQACST